MKLKKLSTKLAPCLLILAALIIFSGCAEDKDPSNMSNATYLGSAACAVCHGDIYSTFIESGHPFKLTKVAKSTAPTYPFSTVPTPPTTTSTTYAWSNITYVIGGYGWKARFMDDRGYIITGDTGDTTQYNIEDSTWSNYNSGTVDKPYDCGSCHTTGWNPTGGNQDSLAGISGTFALAGVQCERCHGAGSTHVDTVSKDYITKNSTAAACGQCHYRDAEHRIEVSGNLIRHHEQYDEFIASPHATALTCVTCHDPH